MLKRWIALILLCVVTAAPAAATAPPSVTQ